MPWKICATCKHLSIAETGREFEKIADTEYIVFKCNILGWESREDYLMEPVETDLSDFDHKICEFWEPWDG